MMQVAVDDRGFEPSMATGDHVKDDIASEGPLNETMADANISTGRWTRQEHEAFLAGLEEYGREWKKVAEKIPTRNSAQIRSHAQKYFAKLSKENQHHPALAGSMTKPLHSSSNSLGLIEVASDSLPDSVIAKIDQITRDPDLVQREVEATLRMLRDRYELLKQQLVKAQQKRQGGISQSSTRIVPPLVETAQVPSSLTDASNSAPIATMSRLVPSQTEANSVQITPQRSSVHETHARELIALQVLGRDLSGLPSKTSPSGTNGTKRKLETLNSQ